MLEDEPQDPPNHLLPLGLENASKFGASGESGGVTLNSGGFIGSGVSAFVVTLTVGVVKLGNVNPAGPVTLILPILIATLGSLTVTVATVGAATVAGTLTVGAVIVGAFILIAPIDIFIAVGASTFNSVGATGVVNETAGAVGDFTTGAFTTGNINNFASTS